MGAGDALCALTDTNGPLGFGAFNFNKSGRVMAQNLRLD
jgi:hypothetical protein